MKVVAVTAAGVAGAGARTRRGRGDRERETETGESEEHPPHGWTPPLRLAEEVAVSGLLYRTFNRAAFRTRFRHARRARRVDDELLPDALPAPRADRPRRHGRDLPRRGRRRSAATVAVKLLAERLRRRRGRPRRASPARRSRPPGSRTRRARSRSSTSASTRAGPYIVMEYLPGGSLADRLDARGRAAARARARVARPGGGARSTPRTRAAIVHRDVKPGEPAARRRRTRQGRGLRGRERRRARLASPRPAPCSAPPATSRRSRRAASGRRRRATATRSPWSRSSCSPARGRSSASRRPPRRWPT